MLYMIHFLMLHLTSLSVIWPSYLAVFLQHGVEEVLVPEEGIKPSS
jgi:hypothetical protein